LAVPGNALNAAGIICIDLRSETAEQYIEIAQKDTC
jgi:hypothetical protein